jgi:hypothetical protein
MNFTGHPAISIRGGFSNSLPVGRAADRRAPLSRRRCLAAAYAFEQRQPWYDDYPQ